MTRWLRNTVVLEARPLLYVQSYLYTVCVRSISSSGKPAVLQLYSNSYIYGLDIKLSAIKKKNELGQILQTVPLNAGQHLRPVVTVTFYISRCQKKKSSKDQVIWENKSISNKLLLSPITYLISESANCFRSAITATFFFFSKRRDRLTQTSAVIRPSRRGRLTAAADGRGSGNRSRQVEAAPPPQASANRAESSARWVIGEEVPGASILSGRCGPSATWPLSGCQRGGRVITASHYQAAGALRQREREREGALIKDKTGNKNNPFRNLNRDRCALVSWVLLQTQGNTY